MGNRIEEEDIEHILNSLDSSQKECLNNGVILVTGCAGFLGYYFLHFFATYADVLGINKIIGLDSFLVRKPSWIDRIAMISPRIQIHHFDIAIDDLTQIPDASSANLIIHMASIASPTFYRKYPIATVDANIWGLRKLLDYYANHMLKGFLFFSSSEVYGDPPPQCIPTDEDYRGSVASIGPRACYDEAKRFGETLCYLFAQQYGMPITIARPFNNYGPGMSLDDKRVPADFAKAIFEHRDIELYSDGSPTRTFCYIADAITGYLKVLAHGTFDYFNIGTAAPEISIRKLAEIYIEAGRERFDYKGAAKFAKAPESDYLTHNPNRRCPNIRKAETLLGYRPDISVEEGVRRFLEFIAMTKGEL